MVSVPGHPIDLRSIRNHDLPREREQIAELHHWDIEQGAEFKAEHLGGQVHGAYRAVDLFTAGDPDGVELISRARFLTRGSAALFTYLRRPERDRWRLRGLERVVVGTVPEMHRSCSAWLDAFWLAFALRDACSLALLLQTPVS